MHVKFDIIWRSQSPNDAGESGDAGPEQVLVSFAHTYVLDPNNPTNAIHYSDLGMGLPAAAQPGDQLILRWTVDSGDANGFWEPNGDGIFRNGVLPHMMLP